MQTTARTVGVVLFEGFELLDVFGPVELFSTMPQEYPITYIAPNAGLVRSSQGAQVLADTTLAEVAATSPTNAAVAATGAPHTDTPHTGTSDGDAARPAAAPAGLSPSILLVPGGMGTRRLATDAEFLRLLREVARGASIVASVCTGSALLAAAGLLEGYRATSNKHAFTWAATHGENVAWMPKARWVADRDRWTSSGVAAGMDMTATLIAELSGQDAADRATRMIEYAPHTDPSWDPFAAQYHLH